MNEHINHPRLTYSFGAGGASVNIRTGRPLVNIPGGTIGTGDYAISISHVYSPDLFSKADTALGNKWKLNIEQFLFRKFEYQNLKAEEFQYIDAEGQLHTFLYLKHNGDDYQYYDTTGLNLILYVTGPSYNITTQVIKDTAGNEMIFSKEGKLIRTEAAEKNQDPSKQIRKKFDYDVNGKLVSVYDERNISRRINLKYLDGLLNIIEYLHNYKIFVRYYYEYDQNKNLIAIVRKAENEVDYPLYFKYDKNDQLQSALDRRDSSAIGFTYETEENESLYKVKEVISGKVFFNTKVNRATIKVGSALNIPYKGEVGAIAFEYADTDISNEFTYDSNFRYTKVTNQDKVCFIYYFNEKGFLTSTFEAPGEDINDLRTLERIPGIPMLGDSNLSEKINNNSVHEFSVNDAINQANAFNKASTIESYVQNKCKDYVNFVCTFWLKTLHEINNHKVKLSLINTRWPLSDEIYTGEGSFDVTATGSWQLVKIPIYIAKSIMDINQIKLEFEENYAEKRVRIADMKFCYNPASKLYITKESSESRISLDKINRIKYKISPTEQNQNEIGIDNDFYISESDIYATYLSYVKERNTALSGNNFTLSACNGTKKISVSEVKLLSDFGDFPIQFFGTKAEFAHEIKSPDDGLATTMTMHIIKKTISGKTLDWISQKTTAIKGGVETYSEVFMDLKGKIWLEIDEHDLQTVYDYDSDGNLKTKTIEHKKTAEKIVYSAKIDETLKIDEEDYKSKTTTYFNEPFGSVSQLDYNGKNENINNTYVTNFKYNAFHERIFSVQDNINGKNHLKYNEAGKLSGVSPNNWSEYGFEFEYQGLKPHKYFLKHPSGRDLLVQTDINIINKTITTERFRSIDKSDITTVVSNKYGKPITINETKIESGVKEDKTISFVRQTSDQAEGISEGARELTSMYDPFENKTYVYTYDSFNNLKKYEIKSGNNTNGSNILTVESSGPNSTHYKTESGLNTFNAESSIHYEEDKFLKPRVIKTRDVGEDYASGNGSDYTYDDLGRLKTKKRKFAGREQINSPVDYNYSDTYYYNSGTFLKSSITSEIRKSDNFNSHLFCTNNKLDYSYDERGNILKRTLEKSSYTQAKPNPKIVLTESSDYTYDKANRLKSEKNSRNGVSDAVKTYFYNVDGSISSETTNSNTKSYIYDKGRLREIIESNQHQTEFAYDNFGNCTHYKRNESETANMEWERGSLLTRYHSAGANGNQTATYSYNSLGIRFKKQVGNDVTAYYLDGSKILWENGPKNDFRFNYDIEGVVGLYDGKLIGQTNYHFIKDVAGSVISIVKDDVEVATYEYDAWGKCTVRNSNGDDITNSDPDHIGNRNPIRWKSQYFDVESGFYYIDGRYYSPEIRQYINAENPETTMANATTVYGLYPYSLTTGNPISRTFINQTVLTYVELSYEPDKLNAWNYFWGVTWMKLWGSPGGKALAITLLIIAGIAAALTGTIPAYLSMLGCTTYFFGTCAIIAGFDSKDKGNGFLKGFTDYINTNFAQTYGVAAALFLVMLGTSLTVSSIKKCFIAGTLVLTMEGHKKIEDIEIGDKVLAYNEETGETDYKQVVRLFRNGKDFNTTDEIDYSKGTLKWCHVTVNGETITSTPGHKYYLPFNEENRNPNEVYEHDSYEELSVKWVSACNLKKGDKVLLSDGKYGIIEEVEIEKLEKSEVTYNFEVEDFHTYYVGEASVCTHNAGPCGGDVFKNGELFERSFDVNGKTIDVLANTRIEGSNLFLDDVVMYARGGDAVNQLGRQGILGIGREINGLAAQQGFKTITYSFTRVANSSSVMKGIPLIWGPFGL